MISAIDLLNDRFQEPGDLIGPKSLRLGIVAQQPEEDFSGFEGLPNGGFAIGRVFVESTMRLLEFHEDSGVPRVLELGDRRGGVALEFRVDQIMDTSLRIYLVANSLLAQNPGDELKPCLCGSTVL